MKASELGEIAAALADNVRGTVSRPHVRGEGETTLLDALFSDDSGLATREERALFYLFSGTYGGDEERLRARLRHFAAQCVRFVELYGPGGDVRVLRAPARITVLGEHVDYVSYLPTESLTLASREHDMVMIYRAGVDARVRGASTNGDYDAFDFSIDDDLREIAERRQIDARSWDAYVYQRPTPAPHWGNYVRAATHFAAFKYGAKICRGFDFLIDSSIPPRGGASSSSALAVLAGAAVRRVNDIGCTPEELARDSGRAEWYVGTRGGAMDHLTVCLAQSGRALRISYHDDLVRPVRLPAENYRWLTFFSHPADKGREVMLEYNERAATARILIPAIVEGWRETDPELHRRWRRSVALVTVDAARAVRELSALADHLPHSTTLADVERAYPLAYRQCAHLFPALIEERRARELPIRARVAHHLGEIGRVDAAANMLAEGEDYDSSPADAPTMRALGLLLDDAHRSLRDHYAVSTAGVEDLIGVVTAPPETLGARLMGGGFGGNVLALTTSARAEELLDRVQTDYYAGRGRDARGEGAVMVSTPGAGLSEIGLEIVWRTAVERFNALGHESARYRRQIGELLDQLDEGENFPAAWPVIVAAGRGTRARASGLRVPKPLAPVAGRAAVVRVLEAVQAAAGSKRTPIVIVSPETEAGVRAAVGDANAHFVVQREARGTGDAVWQTRDLLGDFAGRALVVWSTQPVLRPATVRRTLRLAQLFRDYSLVVPTVFKARPYAPLLRDHRGSITSARETHLESAAAVRFGETNVGLFAVDCAAMLGVLGDLREKLWREAEARYDRPGGELGFPNEMINALAGASGGVLASPIADPREEQGIKNLEDVERCERYIDELRQEETE